MNTTNMTRIPLNVDSNQRAFNKVVRHLGKQKQRSMDAHGDTCLYRGLKGMKCAVGALIDDDVWNSLPEDDAKFFNNKGLRSLPLYFGDVSSHLLGDLQAIHDLGGLWGNGGLNDLGIAALRLRARSYGLRQYQINRTFGARGRASK